MIRLDKLNSLFRPARLTRWRILLAILVAMAADGLQVILPVPPAPEIIDAVAMFLTCAAIGFHVLLLPTFAIEFVPGVDMFPTWTACVIAVIALRNREPQVKKATESNAVPPKIESLRNITPHQPAPEAPSPAPRHE